MKNHPDTKYCVVYARYSSHAQKDTSIEDQVRDIEEYCKQNDLQIVKVYADRHLTGTSDNRPQFQQMMKDAAHGRWSYVVVWKTDRFARNRYDSATYKYRLKRHGVRVLSAKEAIPDGPEGILLESILEGSAEYYSANLAQNVKRGMHANALECKVNSGSLPLGYCKGPDGRFAVVEAEAEIVREIFRRVAQGTPYVDIANDLNARGIHTKHGGTWNKNSFRRMLVNDIYTGVYSYADVRIEGGTPAIIDKVLFLKVNKMVNTKKQAQGRHNVNGEYLLTGKLFCGLCGSPMIGTSGTGRHGGKYYYYCCRKRHTEHDCTKETAGRDWLERVVTQYTVAYISRPDVMEWMTDAIMRYQDREANSARLTSLREQLSSTEAALNNVMKAIEAGVITITTKVRLEELEAEASNIKNEITLEEAAITHISHNFLKYWFNQFRGGNVNDMAFRHKVIDSFVNAVYLWDDKIRIAFNYTGQGSTADMQLVTNAEELAGEDGSYWFCDSVPKQSQANPIAIYFVGSVFVLVMPLSEKR